MTTGDLDDDGFDEIVVGIAEQTGETTEERESVVGQIRIWPGGAQGPEEPETVDPDDLGLSLEPGERFGAATDAGDIDGEPGDEVVVGAPGAGCAYVLNWKDGAVDGIRELVPCEDVPVNFGSSLMVLDVTAASELDVVVAARRAEDPEQRLQILPGGATALEPLRGIMSGPTRFGARGDHRRPPRRRRGALKGPWGRPPAQRPGQIASGSCGSIQTSTVRPGL